MIGTILAIALVAWLLYILICWLWPEEEYVEEWLDSSAFLDMILAAEVVHIIDVVEEE